MYKVEVMKQCGCFTKSGLPAIFELDSLEDAQAKANDLVKQFNEDFCTKHRFKLDQDGNTLKIVEDEDY